MVQYCPNCGSTNVHRDEQLYNWFCSDCGEQFEASDAESSAPAPTAPERPAPAPVVVDGDARDVARNDGEFYLALYEVAGRRLVGSSLYDNVEQVKSAFESIAPKRLFAVRVVLPREGE